MVLVTDMRIWCTGISILLHIFAIPLWSSCSKWDQLLCWLFGRTKAHCTAHKSHLYVKVSSKMYILCYHTISKSTKPNIHLKNFIVWPGILLKFKVCKINLKRSSGTEFIYQNWQLSRMGETTIIYIQTTFPDGSKTEIDHQPNQHRKSANNVTTPNKKALSNQFL